MPLTNKVDSLQSSVRSMPCPVTWVSPFLACAAGGGAAKATAMVMTPAASDAATVFHFTAGPPSTGRVMLD
ncbi:Uncharacterised protein [Mycobacterium tuberculosis]|uniref:Uncharacterized protein n=1 Tax=Mycobacterium tuberculosis TaxID=1773 RepID=A0A654TYA9_MYCTX|nr:Uncharacterised protein [Mycobacterium tuberculosis]CKO07501.1 Uncharacterised protein [Mycobacterium tuberculosis]CKP41983.1 Uncharacterised protein [Mycobacterium tuberculosis]CKT45359.1 Uncharacterised protein [Mycobacterium tuberculosis]CNM46602.1 Uncharacterised protein [Mycobacterium tuberculosis]